jgi:vanillate O-demethylase ferredoxin subunit
MVKLHLSRIWGAKAQPKTQPGPRQPDQDTSTGDGTSPQPGGGFTVELRQSGKSFYVPPDKSILEVLVEAGLDPPYDCTRGECGTCQVRVLEGVPEHHDTYLSDAQKKAGDVMQICVSRSRTGRLVLDM